MQETSQASAALITSTYCKEQMDWEETEFKQQTFVIYGLKSVCASTERCGDEMRESF